MMKLLRLWLFVVIVISVKIGFADSAITSYRIGDYTKAASLLLNNAQRDSVTDYYLGRMNLYGYGALKNNTLAIRYFKQSALKGYLPAQQFMAHYELYTMNNPEEALVWFKKAADLNDVSAQMYCAAAYRYGVGTRKNEDLAKRYYIAAARNGNSIAQYSLAQSFLDTKQAANKQLGMIWLNKSVAQGNPVAQTLLADQYIVGQTVDKDLTKANELLKLAMDQHYLPARYQMGKLAQEQRNYDQAKDWYTQSANEGYTPAQMALATLYLNKDVPFHDDHTGFLWMLKAAQNGYGPAQRELAAMYQTGKAVVANANLAKSWLDQIHKSENQSPLAEAMKQAAGWLTNGKQTTLAASGYRLTGILSPWENQRALRENSYNQAPAMSSITRDSLFKPEFVMVNPNQIPMEEYYNALIATKNMPQTKELVLPDYSMKDKFMARLSKKTIPNFSTSNMTKSSADSYSFSTDPIVDKAPTGQVLTSAEKNQKNTQDTVKVVDPIAQLKSQAVLGDPDSQFNLAQLYRLGVSVKQDLALAQHYYELAAAQKDLRSEYMLAKMHLANHQEKLALDELSSAAFSGDPLAQYALGQIKNYGLRGADGVFIIEPNTQQAIALYSLAAANAYPPAQYQLAELMIHEHPNNLSVAVKEKQNQIIKSLYQGAVSGGIDEAEIPLAYFNAMDSDKNIQNKAFLVAQKKADAGDMSAALLLGLMYDRGLAIEANHSTAMDWYQKAEGNAVGAFILGTYLCSDKGFSQDITRGTTLLKQAADSGFSYANLNLAVMEEQKGEPFLSELNKAIDLNNSNAAILLADYYLSRNSDAEQEKQARSIFQQLAEKGHRDAQLKLAYMMDEGLGGAQDKLNAEHWYRLAALQNQEQAQYLLGRTYQLGFMNNQPDYAEAKQWYTKAQSSYAPAAVALGFIYDTVDDNYPMAESSYQLAASTGSPVGLFDLGLINEQGKGKPVNFELARDYYTQAANHGNTQAMVQLAGLYLHGLGGARDEAEARAWYDKAVQAGDTDAAYHRGLLSETGVGIELNHAEAVKYYQQASDKGNTKATLALARMYQHGIGVSENQQQAIQLYQDLSLRDNPYAQYQLAKIYFTQEGNKPDGKGMKLLSQAEENGSRQASNTLQWLKSQSSDRTSYLAPITLSQSTDMEQEPVDMMYLHALNAWNRGEEDSSKRILTQIVTQYPDYVPAKKTYEELSQQASYQHAS